MVWAWGPAFISMLECMVFSALKGRNSNIAEEMRDFNCARMEYYDSEKGAAAFEEAFRLMEWPRHKAGGEGRNRAAGGEGEVPPGDDEEL